MADDWKSLPDVEQPKSDWKSLPDVEAPKPEPSFFQNVSDFVQGKPHQGKPLGSEEAVVMPASPEQMAAAKAQTEANELGSRTAAKKSLYGTVLAGLKYPSQGAIPVASGIWNAIPRAIGDYVAGGKRMGAPGPGLLDAYRKERDSAKEAQDSALAEHPIAPYVGAAASIPVSGGSALARMGVNGLQMAVQSAFDSPGDLTKGEFGQVGKDALKGGLAGMAASGASEVIGMPFKYLANKGANLVQRGTQTIANRAQEGLDEAVGSLGGAIGGETQKGSRYLENAIRMVDHPELVPAAELAEAKAFLASEEARRLAGQIASASSKGGMSQAAKIAALEPKLAAAQAAKADPVALKAAIASETAAGGSGSDVAKSLAKYIKGAIGATGGSVLGGEIGDAIEPGGQGRKWGSAAGAGVGGLLLGSPHRAIANQFSKPGIQQALGGVMETAGKFGGGVNDRINNAIRLGIEKLLAERAKKAADEEKPSLVGGTKF